MSEKPKLALYWAASCGGCEIAVLGIEEKILDVAGKFEWTGLVIVTGWAPDITVSGSGAEATIVGSLFGEDSVQSGSEVSLDSATITMQIDSPFRVLYSRPLFDPGGVVHEQLPNIRREVVGMKNL